MDSEYENHIHLFTLFLTIEFDKMANIRFKFGKICASNIFKHVLNVHVQCSTFKS